jgi:hypothetical protein
MTILRDTLISKRTVFTQSLKIGPGTKLRCSNTEILLGPGVEITLEEGAMLEITGYHFYAQTNEMWRGIQLKSGSRLIMKKYKNKGNFIEDAETAISVVDYTAALSPVLDVDHTLFNKNLISVNIANDTMVNSKSFRFNACVFTCRDYSFTATSWPGVATTGNGLRAHTANSLVPLASPYLMQNAGITNFKTLTATKDHIQRSISPMWD